VSRGRAILVSLSVSLVLVAIIAVGFNTGHEAAGIFVAVGLVVLTQLVATVLSIRRSRGRR
jgi:uncharacterized membrane protein